VARVRRPEARHRRQIRYGPVLDGIELAVQAIFVAEIAIRLLAFWPRPGTFFRDGWNLFDFVVVVASMLPQAGAFAMVARLARLMRVTRLVSTFPELRLIIGTMLRSIPSMGHVIMLLGLLLYVYAILGFCAVTMPQKRLFATSCYS
jgi:voltage-gated sodium channel